MSVEKSITEYINAYMKKLKLKSKFIKYVGKDGNYKYYDIVLPNKLKFYKVDKELGDYIHKLEQIIFNNININEIK